MSGRALVIGGNGYLGAHTVRGLLEHDWTVAVFDRPGTAPRARGIHARSGRGERVTYIEGSITVAAEVRDAVERSTPDTVIVLSSYGEPGVGLVKSAENSPSDAVDVNVGGLIHVLDAVAHRDTARVLWLSSTTVYGAPEVYGPDPVAESDPVLPGSVYAATKVLGEQLIRTFRKARGPRASAIRPTLIWGPGMTYTGVQSGLNELVEAAVARQPARVDGPDEPWDLIYVKDAAGALVWLASYDDELPALLNVSGYCSSLEEVKRAVERQHPQSDLAVRVGGASLGVPLVSDTAIRALGFRPAFTLEESIQDFADDISPEGGTQ